MATTRSDALGITNQGTASGQIGASAGTVTYTYPGGSATTIGTYTGGTSGTSLVITFNSSATAVAIQALIQQVSFQTTSTSSAARTVQFTFTPSAGNGSAVNASETVNVQQDTPTINPGSAITLGENHAAFSTTLMGINDGESDGNANVTSIVATITNGALVSLLQRAGRHQLLKHRRHRHPRLHPCRQSDRLDDDHRHRHQQSEQYRDGHLLPDRQSHHGHFDGCPGPRGQIGHRHIDGAEHQRDGCHRREHSIHLDRQSPRQRRHDRQERHAAGPERHVHASGHQQRIDLLCEHRQHGHDRQHRVFDR